VDAGGALRVGPESAGANPGPVAYGRGGTQVTVTDANIVLGRLDAAYFLGGAMPLDTQDAYDAVEALARQMNMSVDAAAQGVIDVANANIDRAIRRVSVARGYDPREFTLVAFGGAGPLHACAIAERLEIPHVLIPRYPGVLCAFGLLMADVALEYTRPVMERANVGVVGQLRAALGEMAKQAQDDLLSEGVQEEATQLNSFLDMRYVGQAYELTVPFLPGGQKIIQRFHEAHERTYGHAMPEREVEIVNLRLQAVGVVEKPQFTNESQQRWSTLPLPREAPSEDVQVYDRAALKPDSYLYGRALVHQLDSTLYIPKNWYGMTDGYYNIILSQRT